MRLVVYHYHLNRGGVTSVIRSHLQSLASVADELELEDVTIAYGGRAADWDREFESRLPFPVAHQIIPSLEYDELRANHPDLARTLAKALTDGRHEPESTVLHAHNHALGKNAFFPQAIGQLANDAWRFLLQVHDFVEDLRPANYKHLQTAYADERQLWSALYPQSTQIQYATLNQSDHTTLSQAGVSKLRLHLLPNPLSESDPKPVASPNETSARKDSEVRNAARKKLSAIYSIPENRPYVLYPVRGIRRKNLGELLLWSLLLKDCTFSVTLEPKNETEKKSYLHWQALAESLELPVVFGSGEHMSLDENYAAANAVISTSVAEGFGLVFLEAAIRNRTLFGRNLPGVTADFVSNGMQFPGLANELVVPSIAFDVTALRECYENFARRLQLDYGLDAKYQGHDSESIEELVRGEYFDFGRLDTRQQQAVISKAKTDPELVRQIIEKNPIIEVVRQTLLRGEPTVNEIAAKNREAIRQHYSLEAIGRNLAGIYNTLLTSQPKPVEATPEIGRNLLTHFVRPQHLLPLRIES